MGYHSFSSQMQPANLFPQPGGILSGQAESWLALSEFQQAPACLLGSVLTCGPAVHDIYDDILILYYKRQDLGFHY